MATLDIEYFRIKDLEKTETEVKDTDYVLIDGATNGTRKISVYNLLNPPEPAHNYLYKWDFTKSLVDEVQGVEAIFRGVNASEMVRDEQGTHINDSYQCVYLCYENMKGKTIEVDVSEFVFSGNSSKNTSVIFEGSAEMGDSTGTESFYYKPSVGWCGYDYNKERKVYSDTLPREGISGKTIKIIEKGTSNEVYLDGELLASTSFVSRPSPVWLYLGGMPKHNGSNYNGNSYNMTISGVRIYENEE